MPLKRFFIILSGTSIMIAGLMSSCTAAQTEISRLMTTATAVSPIQLVTAVPTATETVATTIPTIEAITQSTPYIMEQPTVSTSAVQNDDLSTLKVPGTLLYISKPGANSIISSLINISGYAYPGEDGKVTVQLFGEDGRLMAEQNIFLSKDQTKWVSFSTSIPFTINSAAESALLTLTTFDGFGRRIAVCSSPIILLQVGDSEIELPGFQKNPLYFTKPTNASEVRGGILHVEGYAHPFNAKPLVVELIKQDGSILATKIVPLTTPSATEDYVKFDTDIPYTVNGSTSVRLTMRQTMDHSPYLNLALMSTSITLKP